MSFDAGNDNHFPLSGLEPTLSFDGHLLVWQGNPAQVAPDDLGQIGGRCFSYWDPVHGLVPRSPCATGYWRGPPQGHGPCCDPQCSCAGNNQNPQQYACLPGAPAGCTNTFPFLTQNVMMYSYRDDPNDPHGWTVPRSFTELHGDYFGVPLAHYNGRPFQEIYPIARLPLLDGAGTPLNKINGNYCWLTLDATDLIWNANAHARTSIIGASTGFHMQHIDGPVNPTTYLTGSHEPDDRETFVGWGPTPGLWGPIDIGKRALPYLQGTDRKIALYGHEVNNYVEVRLFAERPDRLLRLGMNTALRENLSQPIDVPVSFTPQDDATDDFSGRGQTGTLIGGAQFPNDLEGFNGPKSGESIQIGGAGHIAVPNTPALDADFAAGLSAGLFVRVDTVGRRYLLEKDGSFQLILRKNGRVAATVTTNNGTATAISNQTLIDTALGAWHHIALTYNGTALRLYFDGNQVGSAKHTGTVAGTNNPLKIGRELGTAADVTVDDLEIWGTAWTPTEVAEFAYVKPPLSIFRDNPTLPGLPSGLDGSAQAFLKIPVGSLHDLSTDRVGLGRDLFNDINLSHSSLNMACATCHQAAVSFAEGNNNGFSLGSDGVTLLPRQTPPVFNRAYSDTQLWDARADTLETQASQPILEPTEMNNTQAAVEAYIQANYANGAQTGSPRNFRDAYGVLVPKLSDLELALAAYQRAIVSGGSVVDNYEDGIPIPGSASDVDSILRGRKLFFNKARCATCHQGPNFSDNRLHRTVASSTDTGASALTGRAEHQGAFKTPSLRQLLDTLDYFHNGSQGTLADLVDRYESGGTSSDPEIRPLGLSDAERVDLVRFLEALQSGVIEVF